MGTEQSLAQITVSDAMNSPDGLQGRDTSEKFPLSFQFGSTFHHGWPHSSLRTAHPMHSHSALYYSETEQHSFT